MHISPNIMSHMEMGSKYLLLNLLNIDYCSLLPDSPEGNTPQEMVTQVIGEDGDRQ
jgi:hypothetical protein